MHLLNSVHLIKSCVCPTTTYSML